MSKIKATAWVLGSGYDCDGTPNKYILACPNIHVANAHADEMAVHSDGGGLYVTTSWGEVMEHCDEHGLDESDYVNSNPDLIV